MCLAFESLGIMDDVLVKLHGLHGFHRVVGCSGLVQYYADQLCRNPSVCLRV